MYYYYTVYGRKLYNVNSLEKNETTTTSAIQSTNTELVTFAKTKVQFGHLCKMSIKLDLNHELPPLVLYFLQCEHGSLE